MDEWIGSGIMAGMKYITGTSFNFSVAAGVADVIRLRVGKAGQLGGLNVSGAAFRFYCETEAGLVSVPVEHGTAVGELFLHMPKFEAGEYSYTLEFSDSVGEVGVLLHGVLTVMSAARVTQVVDSANKAEQRVLEVTAGSLHDGPLELRWAASSVAAKCAEDAKAAADKAEEAAGLASGFSEEVSAILKLAQAFMASFYEALQNSISVVNNYLYVCGKSTGHYLKGDDGETPHIGTDGYWYVGTKKLSDKPAFGKDGITPSITSDGYWAFNGQKTETRAEGRDGLDGEAIRFILVDSYADIPQSGETCNGGYRYLVKKEGWAFIGDAEATTSGEWSGWEMPAYELPSEFTRLRVPGAMKANGTPVYLLVRTLEGEVLGVSSNANTWEVGDVVTWDFDEPVVIPNNATVRMFLRTTNAASTGNLPDEGVKMKSLLCDTYGDCLVLFGNQWYGPRRPYLQAYGAGYAEHYDIYAWIEQANGSAGWLKIDRTDQLANSRVYGLMKYATDMTVVGGAPVGQNADGQASVPLAGNAVPGAVMPASTEADETRGGETYMEGGRLFVKKATPSLPGVGKTSYTRVVEDTATVGMTADGKYAVPRADIRQWGCCRIGTVVRQTNGAPYIIPIGRAADGLTERPDGGGGDISGQLMMNTLYGGAIRTYGKSEWADWLPDGLDYDLIFENSNAVGLVTSIQFRQSAAVGLELVAATTDTLAGVYIATGKDDDRAAAVVSASTLRSVEEDIREWTERTFCTKDKAVTKEMLQTTLNGYLTRDDALASYVSQTAFNELSQNAMRKDEFMPCKKVTEAEYNSLGDDVDENVAYIIV